MKIELGNLKCDGSHSAGISHPSNKKIRQSVPNYVIFRLKVELGGSSAVRPNANEQPNEVYTELDLLHSIPDPATDMLSCQGGRPWPLASLSTGWDECSFPKLE